MTLPSAKSDLEELPVIVQTAYAFNEEKSGIMDLGCNAYLTKPVNRAELLNAVHLLFLNN